ncbi:MAG: putative methyltransferase [Candidatus Methanolliviera sp. GoM_asphalt]|nr:MAG: putative methyltransferase [Candidatus Methanolliviera sp. GoM_asphalt]
MAEEKNKRYVELVWAGKYDKFDKGDKIPIEKPNLPFQVVETVNKPRVKGAYFYPEYEYPENYPKDWENLLIWSDNKLVMSSLIKQGWAGKINLIYIDPPFFTGADFTIRTRLGDERIEKEPSIIEERAYRDTWSGGIASYLKYMYERLVLMRDLLAENGSIYVHLDWHVGHYVKVMMDEIFGYENFRNDITWKRYHGAKNNAGRKWWEETDNILMFTKSDSYIFNGDFKPLSDEYIKKEYKFTDGKGRRYRTARRQKASKYQVERNIYYLDESKGVAVGNLWYDISHVVSNAPEYTAFFTQKPEALLKRIILASSNPGEIVFDAFCGSGTTLAVAEKLGRRWIGCDLSKFAIHVTRKRLLDLHNSKDLVEVKNER